MSGVKTKQRAVAALESALIQRVRFTDGLSRIELARKMRLAPSTIGLYVDRLIADGVFREGQKGRSIAGRPPTILELNPHVGEFVGVDFEARQVSATAIDFSQDLLRKRRDKIQLSDSADDVIEKIRRAISNVTGREAPVVGNRRRRAGHRRQCRGVAVHYEFIRGWREIPLADRLAQAFGVPVYLENNIRAMALAERWFGGAREVENFVCLGIRSGIGAGVVIDGKLHCGSGNMAGEIGGWPCPNFYDEHHSGSSDTLEHTASVRAILQHLTDTVRKWCENLPTSFRPIGLLPWRTCCCAVCWDDPLVTKVLSQTARIRRSNYLPVEFTA